MAADEKKANEAGERLAKAAGLTPELREVIKEAIKEAVPAAAGVAAEMAAQAQRGRQPTPEEAKAYANSLTVCPVCKQVLKACQSKHVKMAVYPQNPRHGRAFRGIILNGVTYLSNSLVHLIPVPAQNDFSYRIEQFERNEDDMLQGRVAEHNSGGIGRGAEGFNPASAAWR